MMRKLAATAAGCVLLTAGVAWAEKPSDALTDPALKGPEVIAFIGVKPGQSIADLCAGRFVRAFSKAVGPKGHVYAVEPAELVKVDTDIPAAMKAVTDDGAYANVSVSTPPVNALALPEHLDAVFIRQNYHDLHDKFMGPADVPAFNRAVFAALKPGGVYVVLDHASAAGSGLKDTDTTHRIDEAVVKSEVEAAGFVLARESTILANPADDHTKLVFNPAIRGKTDQFLLKFRKPG